MAFDYDQISVTAGATFIVSGTGGHANWPVHVLLRKSAAAGTVWVGPSAVIAADTGGLALASGSTSFSFVIYPGNDLYGITASGTIPVELLIQGGTGD
jgi:hypothetical protein